MPNTYFIVACLCGINYGKFATRSEAEAEAKKHGQKYVARINETRCRGTRGAYIRYRVK